MSPLRHVVRKNQRGGALRLLDRTLDRIVEAGRFDIHVVSDVEAFPTPSVDIVT